MVWEYEIVGECYLHGVIEGEKMKKKTRWTRVAIV